MKPVRIADGIEVGGDRLLLFAGPCVIESEEHSLEMAGRLRDIAGALNVPFVFKNSFDKANRSSLDSYRGPGMEAGLQVLERVRREIEVPVITDVHEPSQAAVAAEVVDMLQVPAFLCRQTDLLVACGATGLPVNVKKGQFMSPEEMGNAVRKFRSAGSDAVTLTERGVCFGYNNLVVDMRSLPRMRALGVPVVFDCTHSLQLPGVMGTSSGGDRRFIRTLARAAVAARVDALFVEVHDHPDQALSDAASQLPLDELSELLEEVLALDEVARRLPQPDL